MKKLIIYLLLIAGLYSCNTTQKDTPVLRHVVMFKWKDGTSADKKAEMITHFKSLKNKIDVIQDFEYGEDVSIEGLADGYTHCFILTFKSEADRDIYVHHAAHKEFGAVLGPYLDKVLVIDYNRNK